eukprot:366340-Chlamydomonas_euryale.AAC.6
MADRHVCGLARTGIWGRLHEISAADCCPYLGGAQLALSAVAWPLSLPAAPHRSRLASRFIPSVLPPCLFSSIAVTIDLRLCLRSPHCARPLLYLTSVTHSTENAGGVPTIGSDTHSSRSFANTSKKACIENAANWRQRYWCAAETRPSHGALRASSVCRVPSPWVERRPLPFSKSACRQWVTIPTRMLARNGWPCGAMHAHACTRERLPGAPTSPGARRP